MPLEATIAFKETRVKTALVIGGTGGIGSEVCLQLAKDGFNIALHYHSNLDRATELKKIIEIVQPIKVIGPIEKKINSILSADEFEKMTDDSLSLLSKKNFKHIIQFINGTIICSSEAEDYLINNNFQWKLFLNHIIKNSIT